MDRHCIILRLPKHLIYWMMLDVKWCKLWYTTDLLDQFLGFSCFIHPDHESWVAWWKTSRMLSPINKHRLIVTAKQSYSATKVYELKCYPCQNSTWCQKISEPKGPSKKQICWFPSISTNPAIHDGADGSGPWSMANITTWGYCEGLRLVKTGI